MLIFPRPVPDDILFIADTLEQAGHSLYIVGGAVRDAVMGLRGGDYDCATSASPRDVERLFKGKAAVVPTGVQHGTVTLVLNGAHYELTTYRVDGAYTDLRRPDSVQFTSSLGEDLSRRDFTVNAMAAHPITKEISDPFHGKEDISNKLIRTVGDPVQRFSEDALRMLRACRFAAALGFEIEEKTFGALKALAPNISAVSAERIRDELMKMMKAPHPSAGFDYMQKSGLLPLILPELAEGIGVEQNEFHRYDVYTHNLKTCEALKKGLPLTRWAGLLHDIGKPRSKAFALKIGNGNVFYNHEVIGAKMCQKLMRRLKFSNQETETACLLVELHMFFYTSEWTDGAVRRFLRRFDGDMSFLEQLFYLREADRIGSGTKKQAPYIFKEFRARIKKVMDEDAALKVSDLRINGHSLMSAFGISPSPLIGQILHHLLDLVLDDPSINQPERLLEEARNYIARGAPKE